MWDSKPKKITSATLGLEAKLFSHFSFQFCLGKKKNNKKLKMNM